MLKYGEITSNHVSTAIFRFDITEISVKQRYENWCNLILCFFSLGAV